MGHALDARHYRIHPATDAVFFHTRTRCTRSFGSVASQCQAKNCNKKLISALGIEERSRVCLSVRVISMSAAQSTTVHDGLLHPHLRHCSSPASAVRRLPSAVRTATPAFDVRSSGVFRSRPGGPQLVTRLPARSVTFLCGSFRRNLITFLLSFLSSSVFPLPF